MCEYNEGNVVWVKLGSYWWPGEVVSFENLPTDIKTSFHKPPLVSVKFFDEDSFQYIRNLDFIYSYNCSKKYDFIKKGLKVHATKPTNLEKFRSDICKAETRTGGDPNILEDPKLGPEKKPDIDAIFGTPASQKKVKEPSRGRGRPSLGKSSPSSNSSLKKSTSIIITHPRFIGNDDHVVRELIQSPVKQQTKPDMDFKCQSCDFRATRMEAIVLHHKLHVQGMIVTPPKTKKKSPVKKPPKSQRISFTKTSTIDEDIALLKQGLPIFSDSSSTDESEEEIEEPAPKRKRRGRSPRKKKTKASEKTKEKPRNIQQDILAEWDDDDEENEEKSENNDDSTEKLVIKSDEKDMEKEKESAEIDTETETESEEIQKIDKNKEETKKDEDNDKINEKIDSNIEDSSKEAESDSKDTDNKSKTDSCFDFNEEEEEFGLTIEGRKIPRVLPPVEKRKSLESPKDNENENDKDLKELQFQAFDKVLEECIVPVLPEIPQLRSGKFKKTSKYPDTRSSSIDSKSSSDMDIEKMIVATKLTNPKKRFAKNFEDETKNSKEQEEIKGRKEKIVEESKEKATKIEQKIVEEESTGKKSLEVSKLKTQLMQKLLDGPPAGKVKEDRKRRSASSAFSTNSESEEDREFREIETKKRGGFGRKRRKSSINIINKPVETDNQSSSTSFDEKETTSSSIREEEKIEREESESNISEETVVEEFDVKDKDDKNKKENEEKIEEEEADDDKRSVEEEIRDEIEDEIKEIEAENLIIETPDEEKNIENVLEESSIDECLTKTTSIEPVNESNKSSNKSLNESSNESLNEPINTSLNEESLNESINKSLNEPISESLNETLIETSLIEISTEKEISSIETTSTTLFEEKTSMKCTSIEITSLESSSIEVSLKEIDKEEKMIIPESDLVDIEGNFTVVSEKDLADRNQVEITSAPETQKPVTLTSFSLDYCDEDENMKSMEFSSEKDKKFEEKLEKIEGEEEIDIEVSKEDSKKNEIETKGDVLKEDKELQQVDLKETDLKGNLDEDVLKEENVIKTFVEEKEKIEDEEDLSKSMVLEEKVIDVNVETKDEEVIKKEDVNEEKVKEKNVKKIVEEVSEKIVEKPVEKPIEKTIIKTVEKPVEKVPEFEVETFLNEEKPEEVVPFSFVSDDIKVAEVETEMKPVEKERIQKELIPKEQHKKERNQKESIQKESIQKESIQKESIQIESILKESRNPTRLFDILTCEKSTQKIIQPKLQESKVKVDKNSKILPKSKEKPKHTPEIRTQDQAIEKEVHVKKVTAKRMYQDIEDIDTFIIKKPVKKLTTMEEVPQVTQVSQEIEKKSIQKSQITGKPRILQQTIITPSGDIIQPAVNQNQEDLYDINSMPIVLDDQILPPETMETVAMTHILPQENVKQINPIKKSISSTSSLITSSISPSITTSISSSITSSLTSSITPSSSMKMISKLKETPSKLTPIASKGYLGNKKVQKVYQTSSTKLLKPAIITQQGKPGKFIIVPSTSSQPTGSKYTVGKRPAIVKKPPPPPQQKIVSNPMTQTTAGNKIMILTDSHGQQQKVLLTPEQQKQLIGPKKRIIQKQILSKDTQIKGANIISQTIVTSKGHVTTTLGSNPISKNVKIEPKIKRPIQQKFLTDTTPLKPGPSGQQRTIIIKNPQGQTVKKLQGTNDALLDQQVAEQLQAINRATAKSQLKETQMIKPSPKPPQVKKSYAKKEVKLNQKQVVQSVPPLAPISPAKKVETKPNLSIEDKPETSKKPQFVIRDGNGALININEGQILALPSEAIDGQPQSYVLVTIDESGNLTPLNSEALMSLDPNLNLGGDLSNTLLQIAQDDDEKINKIVQENIHQNVQENIQQNVQQNVQQSVHQNVLQNVQQNVHQNVHQNVQETIHQNVHQIDQNIHQNLHQQDIHHQEVSDDLTQIEQSQNVQAVVNAGDMGQLIITGDPVSAQKFLDSLAEGNTDLANLLANTDGGNVLIQTDGQQILINTDADNSMLLMNQETENIGEGSGNPVFSGTQINKNQDILAAALADTDVFQQEQSLPPSKSSQLSPNSGLFPINVGNVLETNTMSSPIMTPLEVPSTNNKKIGDENDILDQGPKNVVLPITITDPSISQTASQHQHHQVLENLDLPLAIQDPGILVTSSGMNSPSFVYSLPTLDDSDINQKSFSSSISMPLLTEEDVSPDEVPKTETLNIETTSITTQEQEIDKMLSADDATTTTKSTNKDEKTKKNNIDTKKSCEKTETYTIRPEMCSSLSEPPPDMFEFAMEERNPTDLDSTSNSVISNSDNTDPERTTVCSDLSIEGGKTSPLSSSGGSCEIPVQPRLIVNLSAEKNFEENGRGEEESFGNDEI